MLKNLQAASVETQADIDARVAARREKWEPHPSAPTVEAGDVTARIVVKNGGTTEMVEIERPGGRFSSVALGDAALIHEVAAQYDKYLGSQS